jgi:phosphate transport system substrate-binding protein
MGVRTDLSRHGATFLLAVGAIAAIAAPLYAVDPQLASAVAAVPAQDDNLLGGLPPYLPKAPISGKLSVAGSSAMNQMALLWADGLKQVHPEAKLDVTMFESGQVLPKLGAGEMEIGLMSRPLTEKELKDGGVIAIATGKDVLGVVVNQDNPLEQLTMEQGVKILQDPEAKENPGAKTWGDLGVTGPLAKAPITLYGRSTGTGAWGYLVNRFLGEVATSRAGKDCNGYAQICEAVTKDPAGVGYLSLSLAPATKGKVLPLVLNTGEVVPAPKMGEAVDPRYPLVRQLYVVVKWQPGTPMPAMTEELLRYVLSRSGQEDVVKAGMLPLRRDEIIASRDVLGWTGAH